MPVKLITKDVSPPERNRSWSKVEIKAINDGDRIITGIATTPTPDRVGDIVEPAGAQFSLPLPLLHQHDSWRPVGQVTAAKVTKKGIEFTARIAKVEDEGELKRRVDLAWQELKAGLIRGVSIGFRTIEFTIMDDGGWRFVNWEWLELSLVTIPANAEASITSIKNFDLASAPVGTKGAKSDTPAGASAPHKTVKLKPEEGKDMLTATERIARLQETKNAKLAEMNKIQEGADTAGRSLDENESTKFDELAGEVASLDKDIERNRILEKASASAVKPVIVADEKTGADARAPQAPTVHGIRHEQKLAPGIRFARVARCIALSRLDMKPPEHFAATLYKNDEAVNAVFKAAVAAGSTLAGNWATNLVSDETGIFADFAEFLRPQTIVGRFGNNGIPALRNVPFRVPLISQTAKMSGYWVGEGRPKPVTSANFARSNLQPLKVANICVATMELLRDSSPSAEGLLRDELAAALRERMDIDFVDPAKAAVADISPASITNGLTALTSDGNDADSIREDVRRVMAAFAAANNPPTSGVWIMSAATALSLSLMVNPLGNREFPNVSMQGGTFEGFPVIVTEYMAGDSTGALVVLVNASDIYFADEGGVNVDMSTEASLQMLDNPTNDSITPTPTNLVSLWQTNSVGFRAERTVNWRRRRDSGVQLLEAVNWGQPGS